MTAYPCIRTVERKDNPELDAAMENLSRYRWLVFTSPAGPKIFFERLRGMHKDARALAGVKIGAIGPKTAQAAEAYGVFADLVPETYDSEHLAQQRPNRPFLSYFIRIARSMQPAACLYPFSAFHGIICLSS